MSAGGMNERCYQNLNLKKGFSKSLFHRVMQFFSYILCFKENYFTVHVLALVKLRILVEKVQPLHLLSSLLSCYREDKEGDAINVCGLGSGS